MKSIEYKQKVFSLKISVEGISPLIWRRVEVPATMSLRGLYRLLRGIFFLNCYHLYVFKVGEVEYGDRNFLEGEFPEGEFVEAKFDWCNDQSKKLYQIYKKFDNFKFIYNLDVNWIYLIEFEELLTPKIGRKYPIWTEGEYGPIEELYDGGFRYNLNERKTKRSLPVTEMYPNLSKRKLNDTLIDRRRVLREKPLT